MSRRLIQFIALLLVPGLLLEPVAAAALASPPSFARPSPIGRGEVLFLYQAIPAYLLSTRRLNWFREFRKKSRISFSRLLNAVGEVGPRTHQFNFDKKIPEKIRPRFEQWLASNNPSGTYFVGIGPKRARQMNPGGVHFLMFTKQEIEDFEKTETLLSDIALSIEPTETRAPYRFPDSKPGDKRHRQVMPFRTSGAEFDGIGVPHERRGIHGPETPRIPGPPGDRPSSNYKARWADLDTKKQGEAKWLWDLLANAQKQPVQYRSSSSPEDIHKQTLQLLTELSEILHLLGTPETAFAAEDFWTEARRMWGNLLEHEASGNVKLGVLWNRVARRIMAGLAEQYGLVGRQLNSTWLLYHAINKPAQEATSIREGKIEWVPYGKVTPILALRESIHHYFGKPRPPKEPPTTNPDPGMKKLKGSNIDLRSALNGDDTVPLAVEIRQAHAEFAEMNPKHASWLDHYLGVLPATKRWSQPQLAIRDKVSRAAVSFNILSAVKWIMTRAEEIPTLETVQIPNLKGLDRRVAKTQYAIAGALRTMKGLIRSTDVADRIGYHPSTIAKYLTELVIQENKIRETEGRWPLFFNLDEGIRYAAEHSNQSLTIQMLADLLGVSVGALSKHRAQKVLNAAGTAVRGATPQDTLAPARIPHTKPGDERRRQAVQSHIPGAEWDGIGAPNERRYMQGPEKASWGGKPLSPVEHVRAQLSRLQQDIQHLKALNLQPKSIEAEMAVRLGEIKLQNPKALWTIWNAPGDLWVISEFKEMDSGKPFGDYLRMSVMSIDVHGKHGKYVLEKRGDYAERTFRAAQQSELAKLAIQSLPLSDIQALVRKHAPRLSVKPNRVPLKKLVLERLYRPSASSWRDIEESDALEGLRPLDVAASIAYRFRMQLLKDPAIQHRITQLPEAAKKVPIGKRHTVEKWISYLELPREQITTAKNRSRLQPSERNLLIEQLQTLPVLPVGEDVLEGIAEIPPLEALHHWQEDPLWIDIQQEIAVLRSNKSSEILATAYLALIFLKLEKAGRALDITKQSVTDILGFASTSPVRDAFNIFLSNGWITERQPRAGPLPAQYIVKNHNALVNLAMTIPEMDSLLNKPTNNFLGTGMLLALAAMHPQWALTAVAIGIAWTDLIGAILLLPIFLMSHSRKHGYKRDMGIEDQGSWERRTSGWKRHFRFIPSRPNSRRFPEQNDARPILRSPETRSVVQQPQTMPSPVDFVDLEAEHIDSREVDAITDLFQQLPGHQVVNELIGLAEKSDFEFRWVVRFAAISLAHRQSPIRNSVRRLLYALAKQPTYSDPAAFVAQSVLLWAMGEAHASSRANKLFKWLYGLNQKSSDNKRFKEGRSVIMGLVGLPYPGLMLEILQWASQIPLNRLKQEDSRDMVEEINRSARKRLQNAGSITLSFMGVGMFNHYFTEWMNSPVSNAAAKAFYQAA